MNENFILHNMLVILGIGILAAFILSSILPVGDGLAAAILLGVICLIAVFYARYADIGNS
jgi:hypothetical protein